MVSSRASFSASEPASRAGSAEPLTPRSKIKALLATVGSSDEENGAETHQKTPGSSPANSSRPHFLERNGTSPRVGLSESDSDDEGVQIRSRGKLASRMQGVTNAPKSPPQGSPEPATARERVKKLLEAKQAEPEQQGDSINGDSDKNSDGDEEDLPVAPRRLKRRVTTHDASDSDEGQSTRAPSPGLFVSSPVRPSPAKSTGQADAGSDYELPALKSDRFKALVERKRRERLARESAEEARQAERRAMQEKLTSEMEELVSGNEADEGITDDEGGRRLTQGARPVRKASKKAIEDMNRETQRMARNMQLAHEAKTRKKISKASLFEKFNYKPAGLVETAPPGNSSSRPTTPHSDVEMKDVETPPSSPPADKDTAKVMPPTTAAPEEPVAASQPPAPEAEVAKTSPAQDKVKRRVRVRVPTVTANVAALDSDDDLQVTATRKDKLASVFENLPSKISGESHSLQALRALAQVKSPGKDIRAGYKNQRDGSKMTPGELQAYLHRKARQQAKLERDRRLEILKGQGIIIQTAEEREKQEQEVEDLVAKAREEAHKIMEEERDAAKKERKENGEADPLAWDDSDEEEYQDSADEADVEASDAELSGSDDDEELDGEEAPNPMFDDEAVSDVSESEDVAVAQVDEDDQDAQPAMRQRKPRIKTAVLSDDEAEVEATPRPNKVMPATQATPVAPSTTSPAAPGSVLRSAKKTFIPGLPVQGPAGLGLTQIFAGTMDSQMSSSAGGPTQSMMPDFDDFPDSNFSATMDEAADAVIVDSQKEQTQAPTQGLHLNLSQSQMHGLDSMLRDAAHTQISDMVEFSQDAGLQHHTPLRERFVEPPISTIETVVADQGEDGLPQDSPLIRRGRLRRKAEVTIEEEATQPTEGVRPEANAFSAMNEAAKQEKKLRAAEEFDRKKSKAKEMVEEQAEESEDEYAGLGGVDAEGSDNDSDGSVEEMIDDDARHDEDEGKLAAFYA